jgi:hypothetical protein
MKFKLFWIATILGVSKLSYGTPVPELMQYLEKEVMVLDQIITQTCEPKHKAGIMQASSEEGILSDPYQFNFWIRLRPRVGLNLPGLITVQIIPEMEMFWQKI